MSNTTYSFWTETPSRFRMPVAGLCARVSAALPVIPAAQPTAVKHDATGVTGGVLVGAHAWSPPC